jgi:hypothetical protein
MTKMVAIMGDTFSVKDKLKALGAKWDPTRKKWMISEDKAEEAKKIVWHADRCGYCRSTTDLKYYRDGRAYCIESCWMMAQ